ncbi:MAG: single-stranded DNA-binding protein [Zetaproteobacteria bacterium]|nr:single-stranded DNA-binding protein [Pseudobdellovibrionaceae bacterium]|tara:strand:+ start:738 stop:1205 length:468 start_codon:yes stop_codon:yes gene_type:complete
MASLNKVIVMGNLGQDPELRYTQSQTAVCTLNIATTEVWSKDGQRQEQTEWHRVIVWNRQAENCAKYLAKGRAVFIEGKLQTRSWEDKNGQKRYTTEITASNVQFMPSSNNGQPSSAPQGQIDNERNPSFDQFPKADKASFETPSSDNNLDDIPF